MSNTILYFISSLFEIYALGIYSGQLFLPRHSKHTRIILLSVFCLVLFIVGLFQNAWLNITVLHVFLVSICFRSIRQSGISVCFTLFF